MDVAEREDPTALDRARKRFCAGEPVESGVRPWVLTSWERSRRMGVVPHAAPTVYDPDVDLHGRLAQAAAPVLDELESRVSGIKVALVLADGQARVLQRRVGEPALLRWLDHNQVLPGFGFPEQAIGTNGIGTALAERRPVLIWGREHYANSLGDLVCAASPIRDPISGHVEGVLNLACLDRFADPAMLGLVVDTTDLIGERLLEQISQREQVLLRAFFEARHRCGGVEPATGRPIDQAGPLAPHDRFRLLERATELISAGHAGVTVVLLSGGRAATLVSRTVENPAGARGIAVEAVLTDGSSWYVASGSRGDHGDGPAARRPPLTHTPTDGHPTLSAEPFTTPTTVDDITSHAPTLIDGTAATAPTPAESATPTTTGPAPAEDTTLADPVSTETISAPVEPAAAQPVSAVPPPGVPASRVPPSPEAGSPGLGSPGHTSSGVTSAQPGSPGTGSPLPGVPLSGAPVSAAATDRWLLAVGEPGVGRLAVQARERLSLIWEAGARVGTSLEVTRTAQELTEVAVPRFADFAAVDLPDPVLCGDEPGVLDAGLRRIALATTLRNFDLADVGALIHPPPATPQGRCLAGGESVLEPELDMSLWWMAQDPERGQRVREQGIHSLIVVPLRARDVTLGVVSFYRSRRMSAFEEDDLALAEELVGRAAVCVDNARRYTHEHTMSAQLERAAESLKQSLDRQRRFTTDASHELRTPLAGLRAQLEEAQLHPGETDLSDLLEHALGDVDRLQAIITDLLLMAQLEAIPASAFERVDLAEIVKAEAACRAGDRCPARLDLESGVIVDAVPTQIRRVLGNLLDNARRHAAHSVVAGVSRTGDLAELTVTDDGPGIPEAEREHVFQRFARLDTARSRGHGGAGLGLAIARDIAHAHRGTLHVEEACPHGARFVFHLPLATEPPAPEPAQSNPKRPQRSRRSRRT
ncbi:ATP-binding protein [Nonomuraea sp. B12E4]|uniref:ATP-binding protein n=1 Tax=Nonomuraea sp. B12E4 TaxID=3153564 RepID=UPI00325F323B